MMFRGREVTHPELGERILKRLAEDVTGIGGVETGPKLDGRNMTMQFAPEKRRRETPVDEAVAAKNEVVSTDDMVPVDDAVPTDDAVTTDAAVPTDEAVPTDDTARTQEAAAAAEE
jgi:translation initiation factor IF-3